jgi:hypothetical protein
VTPPHFPPFTTELLEFLSQTWIYDVQGNCTLEEYKYTRRPLPIRGTVIVNGRKVSWCMWFFSIVSTYDSTISRSFSVHNAPRKTRRSRSLIVAVHSADRPVHFDGRSWRNVAHLLRRRSCA